MNLFLSKVNLRISKKVSRIFVRHFLMHCLILNMGAACFYLIQIAWLLVARHNMAGRKPP